MVSCKSARRPTPLPSLLSLSLDAPSTPVVAFSLPTGPKQLAWESAWLHPSAGETGRILVLLCVTRLSLGLFYIFPNGLFLRFCQASLDRGGKLGSASRGPDVNLGCLLPAPTPRCCGFSRNTSLVTVRVRVPPAGGEVPQNRGA